MCASVVIPATPDNAKVCDYIFPNREGREAHDFKGTCEDGWYRNHIWCDGRGENPFSFAMKVEPTGTNYAMFQFWGGEWDLRDFDITVDGVAVGHQVLQNNYRGHYFNVAFPSQPSLLQVKKAFAWVFQAKQEPRWEASHPVIRLMCPIRPVAFSISPPPTALLLFRVAMEPLFLIRRI